MVYIRFLLPKEDEFVRDFVIYQKLFRYETLKEFEGTKYFRNGAISMDYYYLSLNIAR